MTLLGDLSTDAFIRDHWQRAPLLVRQALPTHDVTPAIDALMSLAGEPDVESRLVVGDGDTRPFACEHGPFEAPQLSPPPMGPWTLLVQSVDEWLPAAGALLAHFDFLPRWRVDDVMVSIASAGGGVGPHFDYYDVFLVQVAGRRRWRIGPHCDDATALADHPDLKLLAHFEEHEAHDLEPGDLLYVPPGVAHWGTALDDGCITCSVGFRAPSHGELLTGAAETLAATLPGDRRYTDSTEGFGTDPFLLDAGVRARLMECWTALSPAEVEAALTRALGCLATEPRGGIVDEYPDVDVPATFALAAAGALDLEHAPGSRFAYTGDGNATELYADGDPFPCSAAFARGICHGRLPAGAIDAPRDRAVFEELLERGAVTPAGR